MQVLGPSGKVDASSSANPSSVSTSSTRASTRAPTSETPSSSSTTSAVAAARTPRLRGYDSPLTTLDKVPAAGFQSASHLKNRILPLYASLAAAPSLAPSPRVNVVFSELVALTNSANDATSRKLLADPEIAAIVPHLRELCATGEGLLEGYWADRIVNARRPASMLQQFPYFQNYVQLARMEAHALRGVTDAPLKRAVFIGSGPMPLSSIMLETRHGFTVDNLDINGHALTQGARVAEAAGATNQRFFHSDIHGYAKEDLRQADVVCVAALAGLDPKQKAEITDVLAREMRPGALLLVRSADRLRGLLYPVVDEVQGFTPEIIVHPRNDVVNSVLISSR